MVSFSNIYTDRLFAQATVFYELAMSGGFTETINLTYVLYLQNLRKSVQIR